MMTKNKLYTKVKYLSLACLMLAFASCSDDFFNVEVGERITEDEHYKDYIDAQASFYGTLIPLQDVAAYSVLVDGLRSDQMVLNDNATSDLLEIANLNMRAENPFLNKSAYYRSIINVNEVLAQIDKAEIRDRDFLPTELLDMKATLYGLRAWCYLNLVRNYGEVNYLSDNVIELPEQLDGNILLKEALLDTLINQFHSDSVIYEGGLSRTEYVYTQFPNYKAVLGELYLEQGDYANAEKYLKLGLESVPNRRIGLNEISGLSISDVYKVNGDFSNFSWDNIFNNAEDQYKENICVIPYSQNDRQPNPIVQYFLPTDLYMVKPAQHLVDSFFMARQAGSTPVYNDQYRGFMYTFDYVNYDSLTFVQNLHFINKYSINSNDPYSSDVILQRAADLNLLLAEALNRNGRTDVALMLMNSGIFNQGAGKRPLDFGYWVANRGIRGRVGLAPREVPDSIVGTERIELVEDYIIEEKAMECAFEGKRMSDLIRVAKRRDNPGEYIGSIIARKYDDPAKKAMVKSYYANEQNWYLPNN